MKGKKNSEDEDAEIGEADFDEDYDNAYPEEKPGKKSRSVYRQGGKYRSTKIKPS